MRELTKSMLSFGWALPLFGAGQMARLATDDGRRRAARAFDGVARAAEEELDGVFGRAAQLGHCVENAAFTMGPSLLRPELLDPAVWLRGAAGLARRTADGLRQLPSGNASAAFDEVRSKGEVFCLVLDVGRILGVPDQPPFPFPLLHFLDRAYALDPFATLWAVEGLGHAYADASLAAGVETRGILAGDAPAGLPPKSFLMLHAGIGLGFAQNLLDGAERVPAGELGRRVAEIVRLCRVNSRPGSLGAALESLGLVARTFHPSLVAAVDGALRQAAPEARGYFWHGVGRALYFLPENFLPWSAVEVFGAARREPPDEAARQSAVAGAAWAASLVGQRDPRILDELVVGPLGESLAADGAFANGVASAAIMRRDTTPGAAFVERFFEWRPADPRRADLWDRLVRRPSARALDDWYPVLSRHDRLGEVFEFRDLAALAARLEAGGVP